MTAAAQTVPGTRTHRKAVRRQADRLAALRRGAPWQPEARAVVVEALLELPTLHIVTQCVDHFLAGQQLPLPAEIYAWERARQARRAQPKECERCTGTGYVDAPDIYQRGPGGTVVQVLSAVRPCPACKPPIRP